MSIVEVDCGQDALVGGLEHEFYMNLLSHLLGISSSQLTNSNLFQRGRLNHQPVLIYDDLIERFNDDFKKTDVNQQQLPL